MRRSVSAAASLLAALALAACGGEGGDSSEPSGTTPALGYNETLQPDGGGNELLAASGASFVRTPLNWSAVERSPGGLDFTRPDAIAAELERWGLRPLWVLSSAPCWASQTPCEAPQPALAPKPDRIDEYAEFAVAVAERYPAALGIEVWNEPNIPNFWRPEPQPDLYRELLAATAEAVRKSGSEVPVVMGGPSPVTPRQAAEAPAKIPFAEFITDTMAGPEAPEVDAIGVHPYSLLLSTDDPVGKSLELFERASAAAEAAAPGVPIWVTEIGLTTAGRFGIEPDEQAAGLVELFEALAEAGAPVITVHRFFDQADPEFAFESGFGVVAEDRKTPKESFCALAEVAGAACGE